MSKPENPKLVRTRHDAGAELVESDITLRDLFAGMALQGMLATDAQPEPILDHVDKLNFASEAYEWADAMLRAREAGK